LFNAYFHFSQGVPGIALNAWIANITAVDTELLTIKKPVTPNVDLLDTVDPDWLVVFALFIQHKNIDIEKLSRITDSNYETAEKLMNNLINSGIIVAKGNQTFTFERNIEPLIVNLCLEKGII